MKIPKGLEKELDTPLEIDPSGFLARLSKSGKVMIMIIYQDSSYKLFYKKLSEYAFKIKNFRYIINPSCIKFGKNPLLIYFYNNPNPINFNYSVTEKSPEGKVVIDSKLLDTLMSTSIVNKIYAENGFNTKTLIIILITLALITLIFLQVFGVVDVIGMLSGRVK